MRSGALILFICAGLLLSGGSVLCFSTLWSLLRMSYFFWSTELGVELSTSALFVTGALLCLPASWLATLVPQHSKSLTLMCTLMVVSSVSLVLLAAGLGATSGLAGALREPSVLNASMLRSMAYDSFDPSVRSSFAAMQLELKCCGVMSYTDWYEYRRTLPPSCCGKMTYRKVDVPCPIPSAHPTGCLRPALAQLRSFVSSLASVSAALVVVMVMSLSFWHQADVKCATPLFDLGCLRPALLELRHYVRSTCMVAAILISVMGITLFTTAYLLVSNVVERRESSMKPQTQTVRIACIAPHGAPPLVSLTSPTLLPNPVPNNHM